MSIDTLQVIAGKVPLVLFLVALHAVWQYVEDRHAALVLHGLERMFVLILADYREIRAKEVTNTIYSDREISFEFVDN